MELLSHLLNHQWKYTIRETSLLMRISQSIGMHQTSKFISSIRNMKIYFPEASIGECGLFQGAIRLLVMNDLLDSEKIEAMKEVICNRQATLTEEELLLLELGEKL